MAKPRDRHRGQGSWEAVDGRERRRLGWIISFRDDRNGAEYATQEEGPLKVAVLSAALRLHRRTESLDGWRIVCCSCPETIWRDLGPRERRYQGRRGNYEGRLVVDVLTDKATSLGASRG